MISILLVSLAALWLAYSNGANDNFKGVATLYGSKTAGYRQALLWTSLTTLAGSLVSISLAGHLVRTFSGEGLVAEELLGTMPLLLAVGAGAAATILAATRLGMPTSTTHALTGALIGVAWISAGGVGGRTLLDRFLLPLVLSPLIAVVLAAAVYFLFSTIRRRLGVTRRTCLCVGSDAPAEVTRGPDGTMVLASSGISVAIDQLDDCVERYQGAVVGVSAQATVDSLHYLSAGAVSFSRAVNDTPKIAALMLALGPGHPRISLTLVAVCMVAGGLLHSRRIARTMGDRITDLNSGQGLAANLSTAALVLFASRLGVPVSTTHVSCGALFGIGTITRQARWRTIGQILLAWLTTLPLAAALAALLFFLLR